MIDIGGEGGEACNTKSFTKFEDIKNEKRNVIYDARVSRRSS